MLISEEIFKYFPDAKRVSKLSGGFMNSCYKVETLQGDFALRIFSFIQAQMEKLKSLDFLPEEWEKTIKKLEFF